MLLTCIVSMLVRLMHIAFQSLHWIQGFIATDKSPRTHTRMKTYRHQSLHCHIQWVLRIVLRFTGRILD